MPMPHIPGRAELEGFDWQGSKVDTVGAKARPGDFVFPIEIAQNNPLLVSLMKATIAEGGADPEAYVAGSEMGNYNPLTGQQHFFLKKAAKKLKKGVKKATKAVKKVAAPVKKVGKKVAAPVKKVKKGVSKATRSVKKKVLAPVKKVGKKVLKPVKKVAKKITKPLKPITKPVKKVWDKVRKSKIGGAVMNIAAPIAGFAIGGPAGAAWGLKAGTAGAIGAGLASGAAAKATGASTKNALRVGALSGVTMGAAAKFGGVTAGKGNLLQRMGNTTKGLTAFGKTGVGKVANVGKTIVQTAMNKPKLTAAVIGGGAALGAAAMAAKNKSGGGGGGAPGRPSAPSGPSAMGAMLAASQRNQQASLAQGQQSSSNFYNQQEAQQRQRQAAMLNQVSSMGQRAAQLPPAYPGAGQQMQQPRMRVPNQMQHAGVGTPVPLDQAARQPMQQPMMRAPMMRAPTKRMFSLMGGMQR